MFSLVITVMAIALVGLLTLASIYFGGDAYTESAQQSRETQVMSEAEQLAGAASLYRTTHLAKVDSVSTLVDTGFLNNLPSGGWGVGDGYIEMPAHDRDTSVCHAMNEKQTGDQAIPACADVSPGDARIMCCTL